MADLTQTRMTAAEFLALPESDVPMQLIDGEVVVSPTPIPFHQKLIFRLAKLVDRLIPNGEVIVSPMDVHFGDGAVFQPEFFWVAADSRCVEQATYYVGAPELVVEIISPSTAKYDRGRKFHSYQAHGVAEYWIVEKSFLEVWVLDGDHYVQQGVYEEGDTFTSKALGRDVKLDGIFD